MRTVVFRVDASMEIGNGHVMRCLTLAVALRTSGAKCLFICRNKPGHLINEIRGHGFEVVTLELISPMADCAAEERSYARWLGAPNEVDATETVQTLLQLAPCEVIVDHYAIDLTWERQVRPHCQQLMVIDDLADRQHDCDLLIDQSPGRQNESYEGLVPQGCTMLCGSSYALLRTEFAKWRSYSIERRKVPKLRHLFISMGGVDGGNIAGQVLEALKGSNLPRGCRLTLVVGPQALWLQELRAQARDMPWTCDIQTGVRDMAKLMADSDVAIGAGGVTALERCVLGLPSLIIVTAENQRNIAQVLHESQAALTTTLEAIQTSLDQLNTNQIQLMSKAASGICDGHGTRRVMFAMLSHTCHVRPMQPGDLGMTLDWRNSGRVRRFMRTQHDISPMEHEAWYRSSMKNPRHHLLIVEDGGNPFGFVQFHVGENGLAEWGFYVAPDAPAGSGKKLGIIALDYAFKFLLLRQVFGEVHVSNLRSIALHEWLGFKPSQTSSPDLRFKVDFKSWPSEPGVIKDES